jgi:hypothetical protein
MQNTAALASSSSSQCVSQNVPNSTTLLSHMSCLKLNFPYVSTLRGTLKRDVHEVVREVLLSTMCSHQVLNLFPNMFPIAPHFYPICLAWSWTFICVKSKGVFKRMKVKWLELFFFWVPNVFPSSSQCVPQDVLNSITLLSHMFCPKLNFHILYVIY